MAVARMAGKTLFQFFDLSAQFGFCCVARS
jgi:hypothetical protein